MGDPTTKVGFVFVPTDPELSARSDWKSLQINGLRNFALAHKYDQRLDKCIGCVVSKDGDYFDIQWCLVDFPWEEDEEFAKYLAENFPFREVKEGLAYGYKLGTNKLSEQS